MSTYVSGPVGLTVPATSANLGPGYDALGLALGLRDRLEAEVTDDGLVVEVAGPGAEDLPRDEQHLVVRAMRAAFAAMGDQPPGVRLRCRNLIPHSRGLGSSSAAIVGGLTLARALVAGGTLLLDDDSLFQLAAELEGHPDNVAPAFYGGFVVAGRETNGAYYAVRASVDPRVGALAFVPDTPVSTETARGLLPEKVPHADAAANAGNAALLVAALSGRPEQLLRGTADLLHQEYRRSAMPDSLALIDALRADGVPAVVSGAGPTVLALVDPADRQLVEKLRVRCPAGWDFHQLAVEENGVQLD